MNHEVVDDIDIEAARREDAEAMDFEEQWVVEDRLNGKHGRIKSLDVAHLQDPLKSSGGVEQLIGFGQVRGHGFLDEHVDA